MPCNFQKFFICEDIQVQPRSPFPNPMPVITTKNGQKFRHLAQKIKGNKQNRVYIKECESAKVLKHYKSGLLNEKSKSF